MPLGDTKGAGARTLEAVKRSLRRVAPGGGRVGVAFSGGVDSSLVAHVCSEHADVTLLTVGFEASHDVVYSSRVAELLRLPHRTRIISDAEFREAHDVVRRLVPPGRPLSWHENGIAFYIVAALAADAGLDRVVTANGIDELFCGYDAYRRIFDRGEAAITEMIGQKTDSEILMMEWLGRIAGRRGVRMEQPLLGGEFVGFAATVPLQEKIRGSGDLLRKHAVRRAAALAGLPPWVCGKRKKALQYGTRIHPRLLRAVRRS